MDCQILIEAVHKMGNLILFMSNSVLKYTFALS